MHALTILRPGRPPERRDATAAVRAGGSHADDILLPDAPPSALRLVPCAAGVIVEAVAAGVRAAGRPVLPGGRRLLRPSERVELHGAAVVVEPLAAGEPTRAAAAALLRAAAGGAAPVATPHLLVLSGPAAGSRHPLRGGATVGRGRRAGIRIPDAHASRVHARVAVSEGAVTVEDLGSKNGVRLNGVRIERGRPVALAPGDELVVGETALALVGVARVETAPGGVARPRRRPLPAPRLLAAALLALSAAALALAAG